MKTSKWLHIDTGKSLDRRRRATGVVGKLVVSLLLPFLLSSAELTTEAKQVRLARPSKTVRQGVLAPDWRILGLDGKMYQLKALRGRIVVLNFWGSWCPPCRIELPHYQQFFERYRKDKSVVVLSINRELPSEPKQQNRLARSFMNRYRLSFPVLPDYQGSVTKSYTVRSFPTIYIIDKEGFIRKRLEGYYDGIMRELTEAVEKLKHESRGNDIPKVQ